MTCAEITELSPLYLSGELDPGRRSEFAQHLAMCSDCEFDQRVRAAFFNESIDVAPLERSVRQGVGKLLVPRWALAVAASIAIVAAGGFSYRTFFRTATPPICIAAARDHLREIVNGEPRPWLTDLSAIDALGAKEGVPASAIAALGTTGYHLDRGRLCFLKKQIYLHLIYTRNGNKYSVYLRSRGPELDSFVRESSVGSEDVAYFQTDRVNAVFVTHQSGANVLAFARAGAHALRTGPRA